MIELRDVTTGYGHNKLTQNICATFADSTLTALIGRNGTGKSTLLRSLSGLEPPLRGEIYVEGQNLFQMAAIQRARCVAYVFTTRTQTGALRCSDAVAMGRAPYTGWTGKLSVTDREAVDLSLERTGMSDFKDRRLCSLSDGEWQRVMIARALAQDTPVIILDEPTSFLDIPNRLLLCRLLQKLAHESGKCIIYSTHELHTALEVADNVALIANRHLNLYQASSATLKQHLTTLFNI